MGALDHNGSNRYLCFSISNETFAIPLLQVKEVIAYSPTTPIPQSPDYFKGIINLREQIISVIDLKQKIKMEAKTNSTSQEKSIVIVEFQSLLLGFIVDSVDRVAMWEASQLSPPPETHGSKSSRYISGIAREENEIILILDLCSALEINDLNAARAQLQTAS